MQVNHYDGPNNLTDPAHFSLLLLMTPLSYTLVQVNLN